MSLAYGTVDPHDALSDECAEHNSETGENLTPLEFFRIFLAASVSPSSRQENPTASARDTTTPRAEASGSSSDPASQE